MVVAIREQPTKRSRLSLFRLRKPSTKPSASSTTQTPPQPSESDDHAAPQSTPRQTPRQELPSSMRSGPPPARQAPNLDDSNHAPLPYYYSGSANVPRGYRSSSSSSHVDQCHDIKEPHAGSLPLQHAAAAAARTDIMSTTKHSRQRSHFSIPDVIVTTCEEDGEEQLVQIEIPPNKRRSYVLCDAASEHVRDQRSFKKNTTSGFARRPAPLIKFDSHEIPGVHMSRSGSLPSISSVSTTSSSPISPTLSSPTSASTPSSSVSSSLSKAASNKPSRKSSFPLLFGRKSLDSQKCANVNNGLHQEPLPSSPITPTSTRTTSSDSFPNAHPDGLLFSTHDPLPTPSCSRNVFTRAISSLPSPPVTPTSPVPALSKKQLKAKAKEELALIKELQRVDKLVKQHDVNAIKAHEKAQAKQRKRAAKLVEINQPFHRASTDTRPSVDSYRADGSHPMSAVACVSKKTTTVFQASTRFSAMGMGLTRRNSVRGASTDVRVFAGERRGSEPILSKSTDVTMRTRSDASTRVSVDLPESDRLPFTHPRAAPRPNVDCEALPQTAPLTLTKQATRRSSLSKDDSSPPRPTRPAPPVPCQSTTSVRVAQPRSAQTVDVEAADVADADASFGDDSDETTLVWTRASWSELSSGFTAAPLPSLIPSSSSVSSVAVPVELEQDSESVDCVGEFDEPQPNARITRRASVQRALAISDAAMSILQKRTSMSKRASHYNAKRRSVQDTEVEAAGVGASKRSSAASSLRRRSFIRQLSDHEGWKVVSSDDQAEQDDGFRPQDSIVAQPDLCSTRWDDWVEQETLNEQHQLTATVTQQHVSAQVDLVLADLYSAQNADQVQKQLAEPEPSGKCTPTQESVSDPIARLVELPNVDKSCAPERPRRCLHRTTSPTATTCTTSSISSTDSFASNSSGTTRTTDLATLADDSQIDPARNKVSVQDEPICFSRPFSPQYRASLEDQRRADTKENVSVPGYDDAAANKRSETELGASFRLSLAPLAPLQLQDSLNLLASVENSF